MANFLLSYAGIPFVGDSARVLRMNFPHHELERGEEDSLPPRKHQPLEDLIDELNRRIPFQYLQDFGSSDYPGRNLGTIARKNNTSQYPNPQIRIGDWFYPTGASRWSVFRGLATSTQVKAMLELAGDGSARPFIMKCLPAGAFNGQQYRPPVFDSLFPPLGNINLQYTLLTQMHMLPPRPLAEHGAEFNGLYLVTLVDERYYFQWSSVSLRVKNETSWQDLINQCALALGITIGLVDIPAVYSKPEPDSQFWTNEENAAILLDGIGHAVGDTVVRLLKPALGAGQYKLFHALESRTVVKLNRGEATQFTYQDFVAPARKVVRTAGGNIFQEGNSLSAGDLEKSKNLVIPAAVRVTFPKYVLADPVPHFFNPRTANQRPTAWCEDSYGDTYGISVPIESGGSVFSGNLLHSTAFPLAGLTGVSGYSHTIATTAKAYFNNEFDAGANLALNASGLTQLAMYLTADYYNWQSAAALDEVYPGTYAWTPEGFHDIIWTYSLRERGSTTRVSRGPWNQMIDEMQHASHPFPTTTPPGVGGKSVAQTWRDGETLSGGYSQVTTTLAAGMLATDTVALFSKVDNFPTQNRWRGQIGNSENVLFEGTSGGISISSGSPSQVRIVYRAIDGTLPFAYPAGTQVIQTFPSKAYGVNSVKFEKGQFAYPDEWTSGGVTGVSIVPQTQTVQVTGNSGRSINGLNYWSGNLVTFDPTKTGPDQFKVMEPIWVLERNNVTLVTGSLYAGQFGGYSASPAAPVYLVGAGNNLIGSGSGSSSLLFSFRHYRDDCIGGCLYRMRQDVSHILDNHGYRTMLTSWEVDAVLGPMDCGNCGSGSGSGSGVSSLSTVTACCGVLVPDVLCLQVGTDCESVDFFGIRRPDTSFTSAVPNFLTATFQLGGIGPDGDKNGWRWVTPPVFQNLLGLPVQINNGLVFELSCVTAGPFDTMGGFIFAGWETFVGHPTGEKTQFLFMVPCDTVCGPPFTCLPIVDEATVAPPCGFLISPAPCAVAGGGGGGGGPYSPSCCGSDTTMPTDSVRLTFHAPDCGADGLFCFATFSGSDYTGSVSFDGKTISGRLYCDTDAGSWKLTLICSAGGSPVTTADALFQCGGPGDVPAVSGTFGFDLEACCGGGITVTVTS